MSENRTSGSSSGVCRPKRVISMIRHAMTRLIAIALRMRSAVSWAIRSTAQPDLRNPVPVFDAPTQTVPAQALNGVFGGSDIHGSEQEPLDSLGSRRRRRFHRMNHPDVDGILVRTILRGTKLNPLVAHLHIGLTAGPLRTGLFLAELRPGALVRHVDLHFRLQGSLPDGLEEFVGLVDDAAVVVGAD